MIIAISAKALGGKTTLIDGLRAIVRKKALTQELNFADALKRVVLYAFVPNDWNLSVKKLSDQDVKLRKTPSGKTIRQLLQAVGTEMFRGVEPDIWTRLYEQAYVSAPNVDLTFTADLRFPNELKKVHELGGIVIRLLRDPNQGAVKHESETALDFITEATCQGYSKTDSWWTVLRRSIQYIMKGDFTHYWKFKAWNGEKFDFVVENSKHTIEQTNKVVSKLLCVHNSDWRRVFRCYK
jgi:hypothetical protein